MPGRPDRYRVGVTKAWYVIGALLFGGLMAMGCGSSISATPTSSTAPKAFTGSALDWLTAEARPANKALNTDQITVLQATKSGSETSPSAFFSHLAAACRQFKADAQKARALPPAPTVELESAWQTMAITSEDYATSCLTLTRTGSKADLSRWNSTLQAMNSANATLNTEVAKVRGVPAG
jgi:hypothetical protein